MMNETLSLVLALVTGGLLGCDVLRWPLVDCSEGGFVQTTGALVPRQPVAANEHYPGWFLFYRAGSLGKAAGVPPWICHCATYRDAAHPTGTKANLLGAGGQSCALVPMR